MDMGLGFLAATEKKLGETDEAMSFGQIVIQCQCPFAFCDGLDRAVSKHLDEAQDAMGPSMVRRMGQSPDCGCLGRRKVRDPVVAHKVGPNRRFNPRRADQRLDVAGIESQGTVEKGLRLGHVFGGRPIVRPSPALEIQVHRIGMG